MSFKSSRLQACNILPVSRKKELPETRLHDDFLGDEFSSKFMGCSTISICI